MSPMKKPMRVRAMTVAGGIALLGATGAGLAGTANAATTSSASSTLAKIKYCESGGNYQAVNASSGASGAYQFLDSTWRSLSAASGYSTAASAPASVQDAAAQELYAQMGTSPWAASSSCWSSMTSAPATSSTSTTASANTTAASSASTAATTGTTAASSTSSTSPTTQTGKAAKPHAPKAQKPGAKHAHAPAKKAAKPHGKDANNHAPHAHGGKHHAKPNTPKPAKKASNTLSPKAAHAPEQAAA